MRDSTVGAVQGALDWADPATIDACNNSTTAVLGGFYAGPDAPLTRDATNATTLKIGPEAPVSGTIRLHPCTQPTDPLPIVPPDPQVPGGTTVTPVTGEPRGFVTESPPVTATPFPQSASSASTEDLATRAIAPAPPAAVVKDAMVKAARTDNVSTRVFSGHARSAMDGRSDPSGGNTPGSWWWLFVLAAAIAAVASGVPWLRGRSAPR